MLYILTAARRLIDEYSKVQMKKPLRSLHNQIQRSTVWYLPVYQNRTNIQLGGKSLLSTMTYHAKPEI